MKKAIAFLLTLVLLCGLLLPAGSALAAARPPKPTGLKITTNGQENQLTLSWKGSDDAFGYEIWRSKTGKTGSYKLITGVGNTTYTDTGLKASTPYYYAVRAWARSGNKTVYSAYTKANLSTRITEVYASSRFTTTIKALHKFTNAVDDSAFDRGEEIEAYRGEGWYGFYLPFTLKGCKTTTDVVNYLSKYLQKKTAKALIELHDVKKINGKLYMWVPQDPGAYGALVINDIPLIKISYSDKKVNCKFGTYFDYGDDYEYQTVKLSLVYEKGRWVFADNSYWYGFSYPYESMITPNDGRGPDEM